MTDPIFAELLETARALRRRRRERAKRVRGLIRGEVFPASAIDVRSIRALTGLSQERFAELLGIEIGTLRNWEQGRRTPTGPARALLRAVRNNPVEVIKALSA